MKFTFAPQSRPIDGFTILRGIQRGGFGEVYYAVSDAGKEVALKLLQHNADVELRGITQCLNVKHPNLLTLFDVKRDGDGDYWLVMEYVTGASLHDVLGAFPQGLPLTEVTAWLEGLVAGTQYLHDQGIVHRDLKPANVFREGGVVKIGDIGLSKQIAGPDDALHTRSIGTVHYSAPEIAQGRYGPSVDVYSLGVMLYEMLTGRLPFTGESAAEVLMKHLTALPDVSSLPIEVRAVVARALAKDPFVRTQSAAELLAEWRTALAKPASAVNSATATPTTMAERFQWPHRQAANQANEQVGVSSDKVAVRVAPSALNEAYVPAVPAAIQPGCDEHLAGWGVAAAAVGTRAGPPGLPVAANGIRPGGATNQPVEKSEQRSRQGPRSLAPGNQPADIAELLTTISLVVPYSLLFASFVAIWDQLIGGVGFPARQEVLNGLFLFVAASTASGIALAVRLRFVGDEPPRWLVNGLAGGVAGALVALLANYIQFTFPTMGNVPNRAIGKLLLIEGGHPTIAGFIVFFAGLLLVSSWYVKIDLTRSQRFSVGSLLMNGLMSWIWGGMLGFPAVWGGLLGAGLAFVMQLAHPWSGKLHQPTGKFR